MTPEERKALWAKKDKTKADWGKLKTVKTPKFRVAFEALIVPKAYEEGDPLKYSTVMLFPKNVSLAELENACNAAAAQKFGMDKKQWPKLRMPFRDGDEKPNLLGYKGNTFVFASSLEKVGVVDQNREPIADKADVYGGCYGRAEINAYFYEKKGNVGITFGLRNFQKLGDGEAFSGGKPADQVFDDNFEIDTDGFEVEENTAAEQDMGF